MTNKNILNAPDRWVGNEIRVALIGCGGNGGEALDILTQFHAGLRAFGHQGLHVTAYDPSKVREPNLVRQRFWPQDIGQHKSTTLIHRYNIALGLHWQAIPKAYEADKNDKYDIIVSAVDLPSVRCQIADTAFAQQVVWLDLGNAEQHGQAVLGCVGGRRKKSNPFPHVLDHFDEIRTLEDDTSKSCSTAESIMAQGMLINRTVTCAGMNMLWSLLRHGKTDKNFCSINLITGDQKTFYFPAA
jgi:PRTRC genetic system ThiF family protein